MFFSVKYKKCFAYYGSVDATISVLTVVVGASLTLLTRDMKSFAKLQVFLHDTAGISMGKLSRGAPRFIQAKAEPDYCYNLEFEDPDDIRRVRQALPTRTDYRGQSKPVCSKSSLKFQLLQVVEKKDDEVCVDHFREGSQNAQPAFEPFELESPRRENDHQGPSNCCMS